MSQDDIEKMGLPIEEEPAIETVEDLTTIEAERSAYSAEIMGLLDTDLTTPEGCRDFYWALFRIARTPNFVPDDVMIGKLIAFLETELATGQNTNVKLVREAVRALEKKVTPEAIKVLISLTKYPDDLTRLLALHGLFESQIADGKLPSEIEEVVLEAAANRNEDFWQTRLKAIQICGEMVSSKSLALLEQLMGKKGEAANSNDPESTAEFPPDGWTVFVNARVALFRRTMLEKDPQQQAESCSVLLNSFWSGGDYRYSDPMKHARRKNFLDLALSGLMEMKGEAKTLVDQFIRDLSKCLTSFGLNSLVLERAGNREDIFSLEELVNLLTYGCDQVFHQEVARQIVARPRWEAGVDEGTKAKIERILSEERRTINDINRYDS